MSQSRPAALTERRQYWRQHVRACRDSGLTTIAYARQQGINVKSLYAARKALTNNGKLPKPQLPLFQKVQLAADPRPVQAQYQIQLPNGAVVSLSGEVNETTVACIVNTVAKLS